MRGVLKIKWLVKYKPKMWKTFARSGSAWRMRNLMFWVDDVSELGMRKIQLVFDYRMGGLGMDDKDKWTKLQLLG